MTGNCTRQPASQPASRHRVLAGTAQHVEAYRQQWRVQEGKAGRHGSGEGEDRGHRHPGARPRAPEHRPEQCEHHVPRRAERVVGDFQGRDRQQHDDCAGQDAQRPGPDVPGAGMEDVKPAGGRDERPGYREYHGHLAQRHVSRQLRDHMGNNLHVSVLRREQLPGMLQRPHEECPIVIQVQRIPGRNPRNAQQQESCTKGDCRSLQCGARHARTE